MISGMPYRIPPGIPSGFPPEILGWILPGTIPGMPPIFFSQIPPEFFFMPLENTTRIAPIICDRIPPEFLAGTPPRLSAEFCQKSFLYCDRNSSRDMSRNFSKDFSLHSTMIFFPISSNFSIDSFKGSFGNFVRWFIQSFHNLSKNISIAIFCMVS